MKPFRLALAQALCRRLPPIIAQKLRTLLYPWPRALADDYRSVVRSQTGALFVAHTSDFHGYPFAVHGYYDWRNWAVALACCRRGDTIIEIGANVGTETVGFADIVGPQGQVWAFEPLPANVDALRASIELNRYHNVRVLPFAVSSKTGRISFHVPPPHASGMGHIVEPGSGHQVDKLEVICVTIDSMIEEMPASTLMVMDTEGEEVNVIRGGYDYIDRFHPTLIVEASPARLRRSGLRLEDLQAELLNQQYTCYRITRFGVAAVDTTSFAKASNWVCLHSSRADLTHRIVRTIRRCALWPCVAGLNPLVLGPPEADRNQRML